MRTIKLIIWEHIRWRRQILTLAKADLKKTYNGAALGWAWAVIKPAVTIFIYWFAFTVGLRSRAGIAGFPFFLWLIGGIVAWFYISEMWSIAPGFMKNYSYLITKMKFPTSTIPTFCSLSKLLVHFLLVFIVMVIYVIFGHGVSIYYLQLPFYTLCMFVMATGWGLFASVVGAFSRDFSQLVKSFTMALFWLSGIMFPISNIKSNFGVAFMKINPVTFIVEGYRNCFVHHVWFWQQPLYFLVFFIETAIVWLAAVIVYKNLRKEMPDVL